MEFLTSTTARPKNLYPCLATITVTPHGAESGARRRSSASFVSGGEDDNALKRVISGGRRRSFATGTGTDDKRAVADEGEAGTWYWRVQAGASDGQLVLLPLSQPPNSLLTSPPEPLSEVIPGHSASETGHSEEGIAAKIKHLFTKSSSTSQDNSNGATTGSPTTTTENTLPATTASHETVNAETSWPGVLQGQQLGAVVVDLRAVDKNKVAVGHNRKDGSTVTVQISASVVFALLEPVGTNTSRAPKSGVIRFVFDKDWIGAKGEAELLHHSIVSTIENSGQPAHVPPFKESFKLGGDHSQAAANVPQSGANVAHGVADVPHNGANVAHGVADVPHNGANVPHAKNIQLAQPV